MANLIIEMPDDLARSLEGIAAAQHKTNHRAGSPAAVLRAMHEPPHLSVSDVDELDAAIAGGRLPVRTHRLFLD